MQRNADIGLFTTPSDFDELVKSQLGVAKKKVQDQGVANPEE
jgi:hypothetical protein